MRRRDLIVHLAVATILWPCTVRAQQRAMPAIATSARGIIARADEVIECGAVISSH